jgi:hypothetical protein
MSAEISGGAKFDADASNSPFLILRSIAASQIDIGVFQYLLEALYFSAPIFCCVRPPVG